MSRIVKVRTRDHRWSSGKVHASIKSYEGGYWYLLCRPNTVRHHWADFGMSTEDDVSCLTCAPKYEGHMRAKRKGRESW